MGFLEECQSLPGLAFPFARKAPEEPHERAEAKAAACSAVEEDPMDALDSMERGQAHELVAPFVELACEESGLRKFEIRRSQDRREFRLLNAEGSFLMLAKSSCEGRRVEFFLHEAPSETEQPIFTLTADATKRQWRMVQERGDCEFSPRQSNNSQERREVMSAVYSCRDVGAGLSHCLDVTLGSGEARRRLTTKLPVWSKKEQRMMMAFKGRPVQPSSKNFQLVPEGRQKDVVFQHCRIGQDSFGLDFKAPLALGEALGLAMCAAVWA